MTAFWDTGPCSLVEEDRRFRGAYCLHDPDDGGTTHLWNFSLLHRPDKNKCITNVFANQIISATRVLDSYVFNDSFQIQLSYRDKL
jgi:hypothetical protein